MTAKKRHPKGLIILFATEMWERFAFYGMRALLVLYLVKQLGYDRPDALEIYGIYLGLVYLTPVAGGYFADKYLGARKAIFIGGALMALGQLALAFEPMLFTGLGLMIIGNGFFKPNISTIVGSLYEDKDPRRDAGFIIFYMGINLGAFFSPLICGTIGEYYGWGWGFASASVGMTCGLIIFGVFQKWLGKAGFAPNVEATDETRLQMKDLGHIIIWVIVCVVLLTVFLSVWEYVGPVWSPLPLLVKLSIIVMVLGGIWFINQLRNRGKEEVSQPLSRSEIQRLVVVCVVCFFVIFFWMGFEQAGGTMNLFADANTDRLVNLGGDSADKAAYYAETDRIRAEYALELAAAEKTDREPSFKLDEAIKEVKVPEGFRLIPTSWFQSINPMFIIIMGIPFSWMWKRWDKSRWALSTPAKMGWGMIILGFGFMVMWGAQSAAEGSVRAAMWWLVLVYLLHTTGELFLSPIGLSFVTKLSPTKVVSTMMGLWFASAALADYLAQRMEVIVEHFEWPLWQTLVATSFSGGFVLLLLTPLLKRWMHGKG